MKVAMNFRSISGECYTSEYCECEECDEGYSKTDIVMDIENKIATQRSIIFTDIDGYMVVVLTDHIESVKFIFQNK